ncbi:alpha/beta fold hydrolase [Actinomadura macrotermitis]|uniref:Arylesterase n=1 Tax=Actinomadura macrotermitis TaxID=2585200 RepID=A0A7K0BSZ1_9ACTN|nr:alpha/beta hydrolase [Actinomadura macrotermitis]MQY04267.1 Arylesterase [Actinomadura macrotermitis]
MYFETADGTRLAYEDHGQGAPILFLASWVLNADMWEYQIPFFVENGYRCIALDRRGHGRSDRPRDGYDLDTSADDIAALLEHLDLRDVTLVGHSMGGAEAARYLARHGEERIARVALVSATVPFLKLTDDNPGGLPEFALQAVLKQWREDRPHWFTRQKQIWFATHLGNQVSESQIELTLQQCLSASPWATAQYFQSGYHTDHRPGLAKISVPALVVHGAADASAPVALTGRRTAELVPGAVYKEYPTGGHGLYITHKHQLNDDLLEFIKS